MYTKKRIAIFIVVIISVIIGGIVLYQIAKSNEKSQEFEGYSNTDKTIVPTVMVGDNIYEWREGQLCQEPLPEECEYYGEIKYTSGILPKHDCEFVFEYATTGQIYTVPGNSNSVYLYLTIDYPENSIMQLVDTVAIFDLKK